MKNPRNQSYQTKIMDQTWLVIQLLPLITGSGRLSPAVGPVSGPILSHTDPKAASAAKAAGTDRHKEP